MNEGPTSPIYQVFPSVEIAKKAYQERFSVYTYVSSYDANTKHTNIDIPENLLWSGKLLLTIVEGVVQKRIRKRLGMGEHGIIMCIDTYFALTCNKRIPDWKIEAVVKNILRETVYGNIAPC